MAGDDGGNFKILDFAAEMDVYTKNNLHRDFIRSMAFLDEEQN